MFMSRDQLRDQLPAVGNTEQDCVQLEQKQLQAWRARLLNRWGRCGFEERNNAGAR